MNPLKVSDRDYIDFLIATPKVCSATEAAQVQPEPSTAPAHDAFARLLHRLEPDAATLWHEADEQVERNGGVRVVDDSTLDKPYARKIECVQRHWSGKHHAVVEGINLITLLWTEDDRHVPVDYRLYDKAGGDLTKNDHFHDLLKTAHERGFVPGCVVFDYEYGSLEDLKQIRELGWVWLTRLKANRLVNPDRGGLRPVARVESETGETIVHLKGCGPIRLFPIVAPDGDSEYWATNDLQMTPLTHVRVAELCLDHRALPSRHQVVLRRGVRPSPRRSYPAQPHRPGSAHVLAPGMALLSRRDQWVRGQNRHHPPCRAGLFG